MKPCRHLDYTAGKFGPDIELRTCAPQYPEVKFWRRGPSWTDNGPREQPNPANVQFCGQGRGRIGGIFAYYQAPGPVGCYVGPDDEAGVAAPGEPT